MRGAEGQAGGDAGAGEAGELRVAGVGLTVNLEPPADHKDYVHRGGHTARAGESGTVVTLVRPGQRRAMARMLTAAGITPVATK
ncbi:hypothetical protein VM98_35880, partial [Streptomyces rubellomurinus subsp. indigoferus]